jgi:hypothetical protein
MQEKAKYTDLDRRLGRGIVFHSTPSNVPANCAFSFAAGLLAGNANIVRLPAKDFPQVQIISDCVRELLETTHKDMAPYICFVKYPPIKEITDLFSGMCQSRVVWGGDATIAEIRQSPLQPRANEVNFADRYSFSVLNADAFLSAEDQDKVVQNFYNDTYLFDQNACSAPHLIFWLKKGDIDAAKERFWKAVHDYTEKKYQYQDVMSVDKLTAFYKQAVGMDCVKEETEDNLVMRTELKELPKNIDEFRCACGYFSEYDIDSLEEILPIVTIKYQTMAYFGFDPEELKAFVLKYRPVGLDRIVPFGETTAFALKWDGYNLIDTFSRIPSIL